MKSNKSINRRDLLFKMLPAAGAATLIAPKLNFLSGLESHADNLQSSLQPDKIQIFLSKKFGEFVVTPENEFAYKAAQRMLNCSKTNALYIVSSEGNGKTHLIYCMEEFYQKNNPGKVVTYVSAERFLNECISSIRRGEMDKFRKKYREQTDVLIIDDVQVLNRGESIQEEFAHTLEYYLMNNKKIVLTNNNAPTKIVGLEKRIKSKLSSALIVKIENLSVESITKILKQKQLESSHQVPEEVIYKTASISKKSVRQAIGNLHRLVMYSELQNVPIDLGLVKKLV